MMIGMEIIVREELLQAVQVRQHVREVCIRMPFGGGTGSGNGNGRQKRKGDVQDLATSLRACLSPTR